MNKEIDPLHRSIKIIDEDKITTLEEYEHLSSFLQKTNGTIKKMTICMQQLDMEIIRLKYEVKAAINEHANFIHKLEEFEMRTKNPKH